MGVIVTIPCIDCEREVRVEALRCRHCGAQLPCSYCGKRHGPKTSGRKELPCFGMFLLDRGTITVEALLKALDLQQKLQEPVGAIALRSRLLKPSQVLHLINAKRHDQRRFGELAIEHGWLDAEQLDTLLALQRESRPLIGQLLVSIQALDRETLTAELDLFSGERG